MLLGRGSASHASTARRRAATTGVVVAITPRGRGEQLRKRGGGEVGRQAQGSRYKFKQLSGVRPAGDAPRARTRVQIDQDLAVQDWCGIGNDVRRTHDRQAIQELQERRTGGDSMQNDTGNQLGGQACNQGSGTK